VPEEPYGKDSDAVRQKNQCIELEIRPAE